MIPFTFKPGGLWFLLLLVASCHSASPPAKAPAQILTPPGATPEVPPGVSPGSDFRQGTVDPLRSEVPLLVGCWSELKSDTPRWVFPMVRVRWKGEIDPNSASLDRVRVYARSHIRQIQRGPADRPVWIVGYGWMGRAKYLDPASPLANRRDATPQGTPGIWPDYGLSMWRARQETFLDQLKTAGVELDFWCADNELYVNEWSVNYRDPWTFRNIVMDERWKTTPLLGLGIPGAKLLPVEQVRDDRTEWVKSKFDTPDSHIAHDHVKVVAQFVRHEMLRRILVEPVLAAYPDALVSNYGSYTRSIGGDSPQEDDSTDIPAAPGEEQIWRKLREVAPDVHELEGIGNVASPVFYGGRRYRRVAPDEVVDQIFELADSLIEHYGGPERVVPWIAYPTFGDAQGRHLSQAQYRRLVVGLAERGIRRILVWNGGHAAARPEVEAELLSVLEEASAVAARRLANERR